MLIIALKSKEKMKAQIEHWCVCFKFGEYILKEHRLGKYMFTFHSGTLHQWCIVSGYLRNPYIMFNFSYLNLHLIPMGKGRGHLRVRMWINDIFSQDNQKLRIVVELF